jgi:hypothetical protein
MLQGSSTASFWENARLLDTKEKLRRDAYVTLRGECFADSMRTLLNGKDKNNEHSTK